MVEYTTKLDKFESIQSKLKAGDIVLIEDGTYSNINLNISTKGAFDKRITIKAKNPGKVILTGKIILKIAGTFTTVANFVFKDGGLSNGIKIQGTGNRLTGCDISLNKSDGSVVVIRDQNNRIDHCIFHDYSMAGVWLCLERSDSSENYALIDHNIFKNRAPGSGNGFETIRLGTSGDSLSNSKSMVVQNLFENCDGEIETVSNKSSQNIIYKNTLKTSAGTLCLRHGNGSIVATNKVEQNNKKESGGIRVVAGEDHIVFNNLITSVNNCGIILSNGKTSGIYNLPVKRVKVYNNILMIEESLITYLRDKGY